MAHGPMATHDRFLSADYQAVKFSCKLAEGNRVSCNSLILVKHTEDSAVVGCAFLIALLTKQFHLSKDSCKAHF